MAPIRLQPNLVFYEVFSGNFGIFCQQTQYLNDLTNCAFEHVQARSKGMPPNLVHLFILWDYLLGCPSTVSRTRITKSYCENKSLIRIRLFLDICKDKFCQSCLGELVNLISKFSDRKWFKSPLKQTKGRNYLLKTCDIGFICWCYCHTVINRFKDYSGDKVCYASLGDAEDFKYYGITSEVLTSIFPKLNSL